MLWQARALSATPARLHPQGGAGGWGLGRAGGDCDWCLRESAEPVASTELPAHLEVHRVRPSPQPPVPPFADPWQFFGSRREPGY